MRRRIFLASGPAALLAAQAGRADAAPVYPAPADPSGAPFADENLKLAVMSMLMEMGVIDLGRPDQLYRHVIGRDIDEEAEGYAPVPGIRDYLVRYPLTPDMLQKIGTVWFDGGNPIYHYVWPFWDGEDTSFDVASLEGIGNCPNIRSLSFISMLERLDVAALLPLRRLEELDIGVEVSNIGALLDMPALRKLNVVNDRIYAEVTTPGHPTRKLMEGLKARGVRVRIHWMSYTSDPPPPFE